MRDDKDDGFQKKASPSHTLPLPPHRKVPDQGPLLPSLPAFMDEGRNSCSHLPEGTLSWGPMKRG